MAFFFNRIYNSTVSYYYISVFYYKKRKCYNTTQKELNFKGEDENLHINKAGEESLGNYQGSSYNNYRETNFSQI